MGLTFIMRMLTAILAVSSNKIYMKTLIIIIIAASFFVTKIACAQGIVYLSNLGQVSNGSDPVGNNSWLAAEFRTGADVDGYQLDSIQLAMTTASGNPSGFTAMLYSSISLAATLPGSSLGRLNGSLNPTTGGIFTYTPASSLTLSPRTDYFIVLTGNTAIATGAYEWNVTGTPSIGLDGWGGNTSLCYSSDGSSWSFLSGTLAQFALSATPVPEPSAFGLLGLGSLLFIRHSHKAKAIR